MGADSLTPQHHCPLQVNRREFLAGCAACAAGVSALQAGSAVAAQPRPLDRANKPRIRLVFAHLPSDARTWPYQGYDYEERKRELTEHLRQACPNVELLPATAQNREEAQKIIESDQHVDGYLVYLIGIWTGVARAVAESGRPTVFVDDLYAGSGEFLIAYAAAKRKGLRVAGVSSSRLEDVVDAVKCLECLAKLRSAVILDVTDHDPGDRAKVIQDTFGTQVKQIASAELRESYAQADRAEARKLADTWIRDAERVIEPSREDIEDSAAMYLAMRELLDRHNSGAITVDCLGLVYGGKLTAYPCLGFWQLNNAGYVGACEADLHSATTMLAMSYLVGRPGYISDPVIDTSGKQVIFAHCVAPTKVFGPDGPSNPYHIRSHAEDGKGACTRSLMPLGEMTTTLQFLPALQEVAVSQGKAVANIDEAKACRNKLAVEVSDVDSFLTQWDRYGWHRVTFYGDFQRQVTQLAALLGMKVVTEG
jgi:hypothetical protein